MFTNIPRTGFPHYLLCGFPLNFLTFSKIMEFFGITHFGPQNYFSDVSRPDYKEPSTSKDVEPCVQHAIETSTCPKHIQRPSSDSFAYGSFERLLELKQRGIYKVVGPTDMYRITPITSYEHGWFLCDPALSGKEWYKTCPRYPQPQSPNTRTLDIALKVNKFASLY